MNSKARQILLWMMLISGALLLVYYLQGKQTKAPEEMSIDMAVTRIDNKEFKEVFFKQSGVEFTDLNNAKFVTTVGSDATRELLVNKVNAYNEANPASKIITKEEAVSSGLGWIFLIQLLPFPINLSDTPMQIGRGTMLTILLFIKHLQGSCIGFMGGI